ncbi:MAG: hypothetical protein D5R96_08315 [Methanocalculus sp. MSAO_Arc2]|uniref:hypothetical protein n=1 Tax=Methanocalculus sp. MSAO_Arc2 TaxID=2293855 RepID=UPI000FF7F1C2|nr:MAG: hypothetical protein D5R96_08315 [Methanocalculus sp. MSAO_Arc2]
MRHLQLLLIAVLLVWASGLVASPDTPITVIPSIMSSAEAMPQEGSSSEFSLTPGQLGEMPVKKEVYVTVDSIPTRTDIIVRFDGGPGMQFISRIVAVMYTSDGRIVMKSMERPLFVGTELVFEGTPGVDRMKITAYYTTGEVVVIHDRRYGRPLDPVPVTPVRTPTPVTDIPVITPVPVDPTPVPYTPVTPPIPDDPEGTPVIYRGYYDPSAPLPIPDEGYLIVVHPRDATVYAGAELDYYLTISAAPGHQQPVYLVLEIDAIVTSYQFELGQINPPYPRTIVSSVPIPAYLPGGIRITGTIIGESGGLREETTVYLSILGTGATIQDTIILSGAAAGVLVAGGLLGLSASGLSSSLASIQALQSGTQQTGRSDRQSLYAGSAAGIIWHKEGDYVWTGQPDTDSLDDLDELLDDALDNQEHTDETLPEE